MQVYEASIQYSLVRIGHDEALNSPSQIVEYMNGAFDDAPLQESFYVVCLNRKNRPLCRTRITIGTATSALAHPREIFRAAVLASACAIVCVHNLCAAAHRLCYVALRAMWSDREFSLPFPSAQGGYRCT
jgi:DNA repair protein RadC